MSNENKQVIMTDKDIRKNLLSSITLMVTSALGPAFLTQTATFTEEYGAKLIVAIIVSLFIALGAQLNVWRILSVSGMYAQDYTNKVAGGLGYVLSFFIFLGGLAFNVGNVSGAGLGLNAIFGLDVKWGAVITALICISLYLSKNGQSYVDKFINALAMILVVVCLYVAIVSDVPYGDVGREVFNLSSIKDLSVPILTFAGGTVGGYITFSGAHRLVDNGITGEENVKYSTASSAFAILGSGIMRLLLFFVFLGVVSKGVSLDPNNPAVSAFSHVLGRPGEIAFGVVLFAAAISSVIGAAYTSASFIRTFHPVLDKYNNYVIIAFIAVSTIIFVTIGQPVKLLILAGSLNGLILPLSLGSVLAGVDRKDLVGDYKHPKWMTVYGVIVCVVTAYIGLQSLGGIVNLFK